ncbi:MAG: nickel-dependent lactate racemase [Pyrinomonadaceae bacterium]
MPLIHLKYGRSSIPFEYEDGWFDVLRGLSSPNPRSDAELGQKLDSTIGSAPLEEIVRPGETVLMVLPDATRQTGAGQVVNLLIRRLIANGTGAHDIRIIFATGIHRAVTDEEKAQIVTPFIFQRIKTLDHHPRDLMQIATLGETKEGIPIEVNRALVEHDRIILVGGITFHYFAGFTGGRKLICPGLASARTVAATHKLAFDGETQCRRPGVDSGLLDGNAVHEAFCQVVAKINPAFCVSTIVDDQGRVVDLFCGHWLASHRVACDAYAAGHTISISEKRELVVVSAGGYPHDLNMIQAHKALESASHACTEGGHIILLAQCADGFGRSDFLTWFDSDDSRALAEKLCRKYQVNGQTAWSLLKKAERFEISFLSDLDKASVAKMRLRPSKSITDWLRERSLSKGYILPEGAKYRIRDD